MANIIPPLVSSSPPPMDSDDEDDDDFGDFANANDLSSYDCDASSLPSSPQHNHKRLDFPEDPSGVSFPEDCPAERNDPKDNTSQDSVISVVTSDSGLSSEINSSSGEDPVNEAVHTDASSENVRENFKDSSENEEIIDRTRKNDFEIEPDVVNVNLNVSENVNGEIYNHSETSSNETIYKNSDSLVEFVNARQDVDKNKSYVDNLCDSLVVDTSISEKVDSDLECNRLTENSHNNEILVLKSEIPLEECEFDVFKTANDQGISAYRSNENISEQITEIKNIKNDQDLDFDDFSSFVDFPVFIEASTTVEPNENEFAEFSSANFKSNEPIETPPPLTVTSISTDVVEDDFDDFTDYETASTTNCNISDNFADFNVSPTVTDVDPIEILKKDRSKFSETVTKTISKAFGSDKNENVIEIPTRDLLKTGALWQYIEDVEHTRAFQYQWDESKSCEALLGALNIDTRNILQRGGKLGGAVPRFAAYLGPDPLEPSPVAPPPSAPIPTTQPPTEVPAAQFDWNDAGLINPLDHQAAKQEQLPQEEIRVPEISMKPTQAVSDDDSVNSLKLGDYDPEPPVQQPSEAQISDSDDDFTDFRSSEPIGEVTLRETHISSKDTAPAWLQPTILTPELTRKTVMIPESRVTHDALETNSTKTAESETLKSKEIVTCDDDDFTDFQSVPLQIPTDAARSKNKTSMISTQVPKSTETVKPPELTNTNVLTPIVASTLPLTPEVLMPIKKEPVIEINWPEPGVITDVPIDLVDARCKSISNNLDLKGAGNDLLIEEPSLPAKQTQNKTEMKNFVEQSKTNDISKPVNQNVDDEDWSDFVSVRTDANKTAPSRITKNDQLHVKPEKKPLNSLNASCLNQHSKAEIHSFKNQTEAQLNSKRTVLNSANFSINPYAKQEAQDFAQQKIASNPFNISSRTNSNIKSELKNHSYPHQHVQRKSSNPFLSNHTISNVKTDQSKINIQSTQQNSNEDDWTDFVSGGQPMMTQRANVRPSPPRFVSWNAPTVPNIITNPAHFDMYRTPSDDVPRTHAIRPGPNSISTISALPDLDFMTPGGMIWPRSSLSKK